MKQIFSVLALFMILSANKCAKKEAVTMLDKKWTLETLDGAKLDLPDGTEQPWFQLSGDQLTGFGGCNRLMGTYKLNEAAISFMSVGGTKMFCDGIQPTENAIKTMLGKVDSYKMDGAVLKLMGAGKELATLKAQ